MVVRRPSGPGGAARHQKQRQAKEPEAAAQASKVEQGRQRRVEISNYLAEAEFLVSGSNASQAAANLRSTSELRPLPRGQQQVAFGVALAFSVAKAIIAHSETEALIDELAKAMKLRRRKDTDAAMIAVRTVFDYGASQEELNANRQYANVHANAVRHLLNLGLDPMDAYDLIVKRATGPSVQSERFRAAKRNGSPARVLPSSTRPAPATTGGAFMDSLRNAVEAADIGGTKAFLVAVRRTGDTFRLVGAAPVKDRTVNDPRLRKGVREAGEFLRNGPAPLYARSANSGD